MRSMIIAASLAVSVTANAEPFNPRASLAGQLERLSAEDRAVCEERRAHARHAYKEIILARCVANILAAHDRTND